MKLFKPKFRYNPETLRYEKVPFSFKRFLLKAFPHLGLSVGLSILMLSAYMVFFSTPEETHLRSENRFMKEQYKKMEAKLSEMDLLLNDLATRDNELYRTIYNADTIPEAVRNSGFGGTHAYKAFDGYESSQLVTDVAKKIDVLSKKLNVQSLSYSELFELAKERETVLSHIPVLQPIHNEGLTRIGSFYGYRKHPIVGGIHFHEGLDLTAPTGTPIYAAGDGTVIRIDFNCSRTGYGNLVIIDHGINGMTTRYAHLNTIGVKRGQEVKRGEQIGTVGNTGMSTAPHLHYEIRINGKSVNPLDYMISITPEQYDQLLEMAEITQVSF
ncbi:MAG TPA: M23 family metallopeptidase [Bacteroidales bacterium]|nr:M23 family metallopeptidase [Bacteroidales bacterium]